MPDVPDFRAELITKLNDRQTASAQVAGDIYMLRLTVIVAKQMWKVGNREFPYVAKDIVQETLLSIIESNRDGNDTDDERVLYRQKSGDTSLNHYVNRCLKEKLKGLLRKETAQQRLPAGGTVPLDDSEESEAHRAQPLSGSIHNDPYVLTTDQPLDRKEAEAEAIRKMMEASRPGSDQRRYATFFREYADGTRDPHDDFKPERLGSHRMRAKAAAEIEGPLTVRRLKKEPP